MNRDCFLKITQRVSPINLVSEFCARDVHPDALKEARLRTGKWLQGLAGVALLLGVAALSRADDKIHTNPLNLDPQVREAYHYFYLLDYPAAVARFERIHEAHSGDPQATAMLLNALLFQELYRQDLLDTTFYANDGFLTGKHATDEDSKKRDQIFALSDEAVHEADVRISKNPNDVDALFARGGCAA